MYKFLYIYIKLYIYISQRRPAPHFEKHYFTSQLWLLYILYIFYSSIGLISFNVFFLAFLFFSFCLFQLTRVFVFSVLTSGYLGQPLDKLEP